MTEQKTQNVEQLVAQFRTTAITRAEASDSSDYRRANRNFAKLLDVYRDIRSIPSGTKAFLGLLSDRHQAVRMLAAAMALEFAPKESEGVLEELAAGKGLDATEARFTLQEWRAGKLKSFLSLRISPDVEMSLARRRVL